MGNIIKRTLISNPLNKSWKKLHNKKFIKKRDGNFFNFYSSSNWFAYDYILVHFLKHFQWILNER